MAANDGLVDSPYGRVRPEILEALNGGQATPAVPVEAPQGAPAPIPSVAAPVAAPAAPQEEWVSQDTPSDPNSFGSAVGRGVDQLQAAGGGLVETVGQATNNQFLKDFGQDIRETQLEQAAAYGTPQYASSADITDPYDWDQVSSFLTNQVGQLTPQVAAIGTASALASKAGGITGLVGKAGAAASAAFLTSFGLNTGNIQVELKQRDPQGEHPMTALAFGSAAGMLDAVGFGIMAKPLLKYISPETVYMHALAANIPPKVAIDGIKSVMVGAGTGAAVNAATDVSQALTVGAATGMPYSADEVMHRAVDSAFGGAVAGGGLRAGGEILDRMVQHNVTPGTAVDPSQLQSSTAPHGLLNKFVDVTMREATAPLDPLARVSPEFESLIRDFRPDMTGQKASGETVHERYEINSGTLHTRFEEATRGLNEAQKDAMFADLVKPKAQMTDPNAVKVRSLLDDVWDQADKVGLDIGRVEGYIPDTLDVERVRTNRAQFEQEIAPFIKDPAAAVDEFLRQADNPRDANAVPSIDRLVQPGLTPGQLQIMAQFTKAGDPNTLRGKFAQGSVPPKNSNLEFTRAFNEVPQEIRSRWAQEQTAKQKEGAINDYLHGAAHRVAFAERFGPSGEILNARIAKGVYEAQQAGRQVTKGEIDQMYGVADAYNGMYGRIKSQDVKNAYAALGTAMNLKTLPFAAFMSMTEFATPMVRFNIGDTLASVAPAMYENLHGIASAAFKSVPRSEWSKLAGEAGVDWKSTQNLVGERLGATAYNRTAAKVNRLFFMANGLSALTHAQRTLGGLTGKRVYDSNLHLLASGLDFTSGRGAKALHELRSLGVDVKDQADAMKLYAPSTPGEVARAREVQRLVVRRASTQTVLEPNSSDMPLWMSNGYAAPLAQLKRYPTAYSNIILPQLLRRMKPSYQGSYTGAAAATLGTAFTVGLMLYIGMAQDQLARYVKSGFNEPEDKRTEGQMVFDTFNRTLAPMTVQYLTNMMSSDRYGQDAISSVAGPAVGMINDASQAAYKTIGSFEDDPTSGYVWQFLFKQTPAGQIKPFQDGLKELSKE